MPLVLRAISDAQLIIVGDIGTKYAQNLVDELGISKSVIFTGAIQNSEVYKLLQIADIEAHWFQGNNPGTRILGIAALEAMAASKVVINTAEEDAYGGGVLKNNKNYMQIKLGQPERLAEIIVELLNNPAKRLKIEKAARDTIRKYFAWDVVCYQMINLYKEVLVKKIEDTNL
jgi:glycosyltransferase involved in cell wall biosynthesis